MFFHKLILLLKDLFITPMEAQYPDWNLTDKFTNEFTNDFTVFDSTLITIWSNNDNNNNNNNNKFK